MMPFDDDDDDDDDVAVLFCCYYRWLSKIRIVQYFADVQVYDPVHHVEADETDWEHDTWVLVNVTGRDTEKGI